MTWHTHPSSYQVNISLLPQITNLPEDGGCNLQERRRGRGERVKREEKMRGVKEEKETEEGRGSKEETISR